MVQDITSKSIYFYTRQMKISNSIYPFHTAVRCDSRRAEVSVLWQRTKISDTAAVTCRPEPSPRSEKGQQPAGTFFMFGFRLFQDQLFPCLLTGPACNKCFPKCEDKICLQNSVDKALLCKSPYKVLGTLSSKRRILLSPSSLSNGRNQTAQQADLLSCITSLDSLNEVSGLQCWSGLTGISHLRLNMEPPMIRADFQPAVHWQQSSQ